MTTGGRVDALWIKRAHRGPMDPAAAATLVAGRGVLGSADQGGRRQVTILERERWEAACARLGAAVPPEARRANVLVSGLSLADSRGKVLRLGGCRILIHGETKPCERMDEARDGLQRALRDPWAAGAYGEVLDGGPVSVGDTAAWE